MEINTKADSSSATALRCRRVVAWAWRIEKWKQNITLKNCLRHET